MTDRILDVFLEILKEVPWLTILLSFMLVGFVTWLLRAQIIDYIKKKYDLYDIDEILEATQDTYGNLFIGNIQEQIENNRKYAKRK